MCLSNLLQWIARPLFPLLICSLGIGAAPVRIELTPAAQGVVQTENPRNLLGDLVSLLNGEFCCRHAHLGGPLIIELVYQELLSILDRLEHFEEYGEELTEEEAVAFRQIIIELVRIGALTDSVEERENLEEEIAFLLAEEIVPEEGYQFWIDSHAFSDGWTFEPATHNDQIVLTKDHFTKKKKKSGWKKTKKKAGKIVDEVCDFVVEHKKECLIVGGLALVGFGIVGVTYLAGGSAITSTAIATGSALLSSTSEEHHRPSPPQQIIQSEPSPILEEPRHYHPPAIQSLPMEPPHTAELQGLPTFTPHAAPWLAMPSDILPNIPQGSREKSSELVHKMWHQIESSPSMQQEWRPLEISANEKIEFSSIQEYTPPPLSLVHQITDLAFITEQAPLYVSSPKPILIRSLAPIEHSIAFTLGLAQGVVNGAFASAVAYIPSALHGAYDLLSGMAGVVMNPVQRWEELSHTAIAIANFLKEETSKEIFRQLTPEFSDLIDRWDTLDGWTQGEMAGQLIGHYGVEIYAGGGAIKFLKGYKNLHAANRLLASEMRLLQAGEMTLLRSISTTRQRILKSANLEIQWDKQGKHIEGHIHRDTKKSLFEHPDPQKLVNEFAGTGIVLSDLSPGTPGYKEIVDFGEFIGYDINPNTGAKIATSWGKIHYAKDGTHIVPTKP